MHRRYRYSLSTLLLVVTCCALALGWWSGTTALQSKLQQTEAEKQELLAMLGDQSLPWEELLREQPITISANEFSGFASGYPWYLSVNSAGEAELAILSQEERQQFRVSKAQLDELREAIIREKFFELGGRQGELVPDCSVETLTITVGRFTKTIEMQYVMNYIGNDEAKLQQAARAIRVWTLIRNWCQHPKIADLRKYDQMVIDAADKAAKRQDAGK